MIRNKRQTENQREKERNQDENENIQEKEDVLENEEEKKATLKERMKNFFNFSKKATHIFADRGKDEGKDEEEDVRQFDPEANIALEFEENANEEINKSNEFINFIEIKKADKNIKEEVQIEVIVVKTAFSEFKEYLNVENNYLIIKDDYQGKDFDKDIKPHIELLSNEFKLKKEYLQIIYKK